MDDRYVAGRELINPDSCVEPDLNLKAHLIRACISARKHPMLRLPFLGVSFVQ